MELYGNRVLVEPKEREKSKYEVDEEEMIDTSLILSGTIKIMGSGVNEKHQLEDLILIEPYQSRAITLEGKNYLLTTDESIICKL